MSDTPKRPWTPGEWAFWVGTLDRRQFIVEAANPSHVIAEMPSVDDATDEDVANGNLLHAAPDLFEELAHLTRLLEPLEESGALNVPGLATLNGARSALAKALGEER